MLKKLDLELPGISRLAASLIAGTYALAMGFMLCMPASASSITPDDPRLSPARIVSYNNAGFTQVFIDGFIHKPTVESFQRLLHSGQEFGIVYFNSGGGDLAAAQKLGRMIRAKGYSTQIGQLSSDGTHIAKGICESACPIAFIGGKYRLLDTETGRLGVHRFYLAQQGRWASDSASLFSAEQDLRKYVDEMGISPEFFGLIMKTSPDKLQHIGKPAFFHLGLATDAAQVEWLRNENGGLVGVSDSATGRLTIGFTCSGGRLHNQVRVKPWFPPAALLNYEVHSIVVDGAKLPLDEVTAGFDKASGEITFDAPTPPEAVSKFSSAKEVGYSMTFEKSPGDYSRSLYLDRRGSELSAMALSCTNS